MRLYRDINQFAAKRGAVWIGAYSVAQLALKTFERTLQATLGNVVTLQAQPFAVRLESATGNLAIPSQMKFKVNWPDVSLNSSDQLLLEFSLGVIQAGAWVDTLTRFRVVLKELSFDLQVSESALTCSIGNASHMEDLQREPDFDALLAKHTLDSELVTRIEGMLLYGSLLSSLEKTLSVPEPIDVARLFPGVTFVGALSLGTSSDDGYLFITGSDGILKKADCDCAIVDGLGTTKPGEIVANPGADVENGQSAGTISIGGPGPIANPNDLLGKRNRGHADIGLFVPNEMAKAIVEGPFPAFRVDARDNGTIGWKAAALVDFADMRFDFQPQIGRIGIELDFRAEVYGSIHIDLGKLGKIRVTNFSAEQKGPGVNTIVIGIYLVLGTEGLYLKPIVEDVRFGSFEVFLRLGTLIGSPWGTWGAVNGYIFDVILGALIASQIPLKLEKEIRDYMAKIMVVLIDRAYSTELTGLAMKGRPDLHCAQFDGGAGGFLFSIGEDG